MMLKKIMKKNNTGFTLLEVLVAVIILAVISVPLLRSFATAAQTNRKSKIEEKCTTAAENIVESFRDVDVEELIAKYNIDDETKVEYDDSTEVYTFTIKDQDLIGSKMPNGYYATVTLDPRYYENANDLNLASIESVSGENSAIYTMYQFIPADAEEASHLASYHCEEDVKAYREFWERNKKARNVASYELLGDTEQEALSNLRQLLKREIRFEVKHTGDALLGESLEGEPEGEESEGSVETVELVTVDMTITYSLEGMDGKYFPPSDNVYVCKKTSLFDNKSKKKPLRNVYLFYYPRYLAGKQASSGKDKIVIENKNNIDFNFYLVAMEGADNPEHKATYLANGGCNLDVIESNPDVATNPSHVTLRTNMNSGAPYSAKDTRTGIGDVKMTLKYKTSETDTKLTGNNAAKFLNAGNLDGKSLDKDNTQKRIYKLIVDIYDDIEVAEGETKNYVLRFDGTKLEY